MSPKRVIPLVDLRASFLPIRDDVLREFGAVLDRMQLLLGENVQAFEREFAAYCDVEHGVGVSSGTDALAAALVACGIGPGDEVIAPSHTFFATIEAIVHAGATPVMVDVEPERLTIDVGAVRSALTPLTKAIVPVHLYGHPADMDPIVDIARERRLRVIEDAAQAHGARYKGRRCGSIGDVGCFSFYFTKNLGAFGEGGFVTTRDAGVAEHVQLLRHHGHVSKAEHAVVGHNLRLDELQAAVLRIKLRGLDAANARRREVAARYRAVFEGTPVRQLNARADCEPVYHLYPIRVGDRDALRDWLAEQGIETGIHYPIPAHMQPALRNRPHRIHGRLRVTEEACRELVSIPMYAELTAEQTECVARSVLQFIERQARRSA
jgi:dTDP-4-amino-4,6-dideoxygalactose transaminase